MAKRIAGITVVLDGDTSALSTALNKVDKTTRNLQSELKEVENRLKFDPGNAELVRQKQEILAESIENTAKKLDILKKAQSDVEKKFKNGEISNDQYRAFRREIDKTESQLDQLKKAANGVDDGTGVKGLKKDLDKVEKSADEAKKAVGDLGSEAAGVAGALAGGITIGASVELALDESSLDTKIDLQFAVSEESKKEVRDAIKIITAYGVDGESALEGVRRQWALNGDEADAVNSAVVRGAGAVAAAFDGVDFTELIQETNEIAAALEISNKDALALVDSLLKAGFPPEQLDTIAEYGQQMSDVGFNANEIQAIFEAGIDTKTWNIDNLNDGVKEARVRMAEFGQEVPKTLGDLLKKTDVSKKKFQEWGDAVAGGGEKGSEAMGEVVDFLKTIEDDALRNALGIEVFGTKWEDQGDNLIAVFDGVADAVNKTEENASGLNETLEKVNSDPAVELEHAMNRFKEALQPVLRIVLDLATKIANWVAENPQLAATIATIVGVVGLLVASLLVLAPIFTAIATVATALSIPFLAVVGVILAVVAAFALLVSAGIAIYKNWDEIKAFFVETWDAIKEKAVEVFESLVEFFSTVWEGIKEGASIAWEAIKEFFTVAWESIKEVFNNVLQSISDLLGEYWASMGEGITTVWDGIMTYFSGLWELIKNIFVGAFLILLQLLTGQWQAAWDSTVQIWENIKGSLSEMWEGIKLVFSGALEAVKGYLSTSWENIKSVTSSAFESVMSTISNAWESIKTKFTTALVSIVSTLVSKFVDMRKNVSEKMNEILGKIKDIWNDVTSFFSGIDLASMGSDIIQGLINGIKSKATSLITSVKGVVNDAIEGAKNLLGIKSPSRVFMEIGKFTGEGMAIGMERSARLVDDASKLMANASIPDLSGLSTPGVSSTQSSLIQGNNFIVREEADINRIARELHRLQAKSARGSFA